MGKKLFLIYNQLLILKSWGQIAMRSPCVILFTFQKLWCPINNLLIFENKILSLIYTANFRGRFWNAF
jgi:hypothetical protein